ncbi:hypothetical protein VPIG_00035 [Vibrio phage PWH3a-P1]|uniref:hypothetical protein n=1 Tax=Vibrio phage PWH3a-P1 TaxID=754058 RepID=UPI0002C14A31|nr:hypothetical protein VPIG_00035 [Vibrio phage PWH3a-P1]AGH31893.1 hypothetical protein VPIG_00035 [Vibrio phage PWH3a-P1]
MFKRIKRNYYRWVIKNLESDLFELETIKRSYNNWLFEDKILLDSDIKYAKIDLKQAKMKLKELEG